MSTLITLGCSFSMGQGCYNKNSIYISDKNSTEYFLDSLDSFLSGSIGKNLQNKLGYEKFYNYAQAGHSNLSQLVNFFDKIPDDDNEIVILWQITFKTREFMVMENEILGLPTTVNWVDSKLKYRFEKEVTSADMDMNRETYYYINILKEYCKVRNWKLFVWFWENGEYNKIIDSFEDLKDIIIPFNKEPFIDDSFCWEGHPNEIGYTQVANTLIKSIKTHNIPFPIPNEMPLIAKQIHYNKYD